jgi:glutathione S-transferase
MKLYGTMISPFVRTVMVTVHELGLADKITLVDSGLVSPTEPHPEITRHNPLGKIPCLVTNHGHALYDSRVICEYLSHHAGDKTLLPDEPVRRFRILTLQALAMGIGDAAVAVRYETVARPKDLRWDDWSARQTARIVASLDDVEAHWKSDLGSITAGTVACAAVLGYLDHRFSDLGFRNGRPALAAFYDRFAARRSMEETKLQS